MKDVIKNGDLIRTEITFKVPMLRCQRRPRFLKCFGDYKSKKDIDYENLIRECFLNEAKDFEPSNRPVEISIVAKHKLSKRTPNYVIKEIYNNYIYYVPQSKQDAESITKSVIDALNGVAYVDKKQVYFASCDKSYDTESDIDYLAVRVTYINLLKTAEDIKNERRRH